MDDEGARGPSNGDCGSCQEVRLVAARKREKERETESDSTSSLGSSDSLAFPTLPPRSPGPTPLSPRPSRPSPTPRSPLSLPSRRSRLPQPGRTPKSAPRRTRRSLHSFITTCTRCTRRRAMLLKVRTRPLLSGGSERWRSARWRASIASREFSWGLVTTCSSRRRPPTTPSTTQRLPRGSPRSTCLILAWAISGSSPPIQTERWTKRSFKGSTRLSRPSARVRCLSCPPSLSVFSLTYLHPSNARRRVHEAPSPLVSVPQGANPSPRPRPPTRHRASP